jgi:hypothetical protein
VTFRIGVYDPDLSEGRFLQVRVVSNISETILDSTSAGSVEFTTTELAVGRHIITVTVSDGEHERSAVLDLAIKERTGQPGDGDEEPLTILNLPWWVFLILVIVAISAVIGVALMMKGRSGWQ